MSHRCQSLPAYQTGRPVHECGVGLGAVQSRTALFCAT